MENINQDTSFNLYDLINKYLENKLLILSITVSFVIVGTLFFYSKPTVHEASISISEIVNFEFNIDEKLNSYFSVHEIDSELFLDNFLAKIKSFSIYNKLALEMKAELDAGKFNSLNKFNEYEIAKYIYERVSYEQGEEDFSGRFYKLKYTDNELKTDEIKSILIKLVSLSLNEGILDLRRNINKQIDSLDYQITRLKKNNEFKLNKHESDLKLKIDQLIIFLNYDNSIKIRNLKEQIQVAKNLGFTDSQLGDVDRASDLVQNALVGKLPKDQVLNLPLYFFGSKILEEELKYLQLNTININTLGNFGGQELLSELETIKDQYSDVFIDNLIETKVDKNELLLLNISLDSINSLEHLLLEYNFEEIKLIRINQFGLMKLISIAIILSLLLSTLLILYKEEKETRASKLLINK